MNSVPRITPLRDRQQVKNEVLAKWRAELKAEREARQLQNEAYDVAVQHDITLDPKEDPQPDEPIEAVFVDIRYRPASKDWYAQAYVYPIRNLVKTETLTASHGSLGDAAVWGTNIVHGRRPKYAEIQIRPGEGVK